MNELTLFNFESHQVRVVLDEHEEPWFVGKDVAEVLGYADTVNALKQHCKGVVKRHPLQTPGGMQEVRVISEPDVFRLVVNSKLPAAEKFERWVFEEVLPSIRKTGSYTAPKGVTKRDPLDEQQHAISVTDKIVRSLVSAARALGLDKNAAALSANQAARKITGVDALALLGHTHLKAKDQECLYFTPTELGKRYGISGQEINKRLSDAGLQDREGDTWVPTKHTQHLFRIFDTGKRQGNGTMIQQVKWSSAVLDRIIHPNNDLFP
jgi:prophage antirepressor-like protein